MISGEEERRDIGVARLDEAKRAERKSFSILIWRRVFLKFGKNTTKTDNR